MATKDQEATVSKCVKEFDECRKHHDNFTSKVEKRYNAYEGILEARSTAAQWTSKLHPPYLLHIVETHVANMIDDRVRFRVRPNPRMANPMEIETLQAGGRALEILLRYQLELDNFNEKQRPYALQNSIAGLTVGKTYWRNEEGTKKRLRNETVPVMGPLGPIGSYDHKYISEEAHVKHDEPTFEVVNVLDFFWHEAAVSLERSPYVFHRVWMTFDELKNLEEAGVYKNVDDLKESRPQTGDRSEYGKDLFPNEDRTKDMIEVLECWYADGSVCTVANRKVLLRENKNPFWHGQYPFVVCSTTPRLFRIPGVSIVERLADLQEMLWTIQNQRIDNVQLLNNVITLFRSDVDDPDAYEYAPGEKWLVEDPSQVSQLKIDSTPAQISMPAEAMLKGDMQNVTGGLPFASGTDSGSIDQETATGVSIITSLAQKLLAAQKQQITYSYQHLGQLWVELNQQYVREPRLAQIIGEDGAATFEQIDPELIQGGYVFGIEATTESLMRQERRAEAQAKLQMFAEIAPMAVQMGIPLNGKAFVDDWLRAYDIDDTERYYSAQPQPGMQAAPGQPGQGAPPGQEGPGGVTGPSAYDASSPSNQMSNSPEVFMQRAQAAGGSGQNI